MRNSDNNQINIPQAREAGDPGGQMFKNVCPIHTVNYVRNNRISAGHIQNIKYITAITI